MENREQKERKRERTRHNQTQEEGAGKKGDRPHTWGKGWVMKSMGVGKEQQVFARSQGHSALSRDLCVGKGSAMETVLSKQ